MELKRLSYSELITLEEQVKAEIEARNTGIDPCRAFQEAFRALDRGRHYVPIHEVRRRLKWPRARFDRMLEQLRDSSRIQLHAGDVGMMEEDEVRDGFVDDNGFLHLTVTWRK